MKAQMFNYNGWIKETNPQKLQEIFSQMLFNSGFNILNVSDHHFQPQGYTALYLLSESHFAIHTFPEENQTYIELSSCVENQFNTFMGILKGLNIMQN